MKRLRQLSAWLLVLAFSALPGMADEYDKALDEAIQNYARVSGDDSSYLYRAGYVFHPVRTGRLGPRQNILDIRAKVNPPDAACGSFDFLTNFRATFDQHAAEKYLGNVARAVTASAPLIVTCYASPTLCDAFKHFKAMSGLTLDTAFARCEAVQDAVLDWGSNLYNKQKADCLNEKGRQGVPLEEAMKACSGFHEIPSLSGLKKTHVNLIDDAFDLVDDFDPNRRRLARTIFGDLDLQADGQIFSKKTKGGIRIMFNTTRDENMKNWEKVIRQTARGRAADLTDLKSLSTPALPITHEVVQAVVSLPPSKQAIAISSISSATAMSEVQARVHEIDEKLAQAQTEAQKNSPDLVKQLKIERQRVAEQLDHMLKEQRQSAQITQTLISTLREASREEERTVNLMKSGLGSLQRSRSNAGARGQYGGLTIYGY
ncbi:hypothetical protein JYT83_00085 [bacterium AH-315-F18]|nr:hypothetical protein [bacterium AH-315-F18]